MNSSRSGLRAIFHAESSPHRALFSTDARPPCPTLFPYTTLFRSRSAVVPGRAGRSGGAPPAPPATACLEGFPPPGALAVASRRASDRKSTRLNSSHVETSYAVFCLKKKTYDDEFITVGSARHISC